jgi:hypothetical protein
MADTDIVWPVGTTDQDPDLTSRPMVFNPKGLLVAILPGADEAERAAAALRDAGFADRKLRILTSRQILDDRTYPLGEAATTIRSMLDGKARDKLVVSVSPGRMQTPPTGSTQ